MTTPEIGNLLGKAGTFVDASAVYLAPRGYVAELEHELQRAGKTILFVRDRLVGTREPAVEAVWADNIWYEPFFLPITSIGSGAGLLKGMQRNWALFSTAEHRRAAVIEEKLPPVKARPLPFGAPPPSSPLGSWTLWDRDTILASARCSSPFVNGEVHFVEDKDTPPNRAYLKLWEAFTRLGVRPGAGDLCLDLGSSPGGWSWVLAECGAHVVSVDKAPLAPAIARHPRIEVCQGSAFALEPKILGDVTWLCSDVACYPERLLGLVERFLEAIPALNMVCTIKLVGATDFDAIDAFLRIPGSRVVHLYVNKHEVTWIRLAEWV